MIAGNDKLRYEWVDNWIRVPDTEGARISGRTHGVRSLRDGRIIVFHQANPAVLIYSPEGKLLSSFGDRFGGAHALAVVEENGVEYLWLVDHNTPEVVKVTLDGKTVQTMPIPQHAVYGEKKYTPTWVAVNEERHGGNGDIYIADGYGGSVVYRFDKNGKQLNAMTGEEGSAGRFYCPHAVFIDRRRKTPELYITDRANKRCQVYSLDGKYIRTFGADFLDSPCAFDTWKEYLLLPELWGRVLILDANDKPVVTLGDNPGIKETEGWPNLKPDQLQAGKFNSPHDACFDSNGNIYVGEWIIGGRVTKLVRK